MTGWVAFRVAYRALESATYERLTGIRESKRRQIEKRFRDWTGALSTLARGETVIDALLGFEAAWPGAMAAVPPNGEPGFDALRRYYTGELGPRLDESLAGPAVPESLWPASAAGRLLQRTYLLREPAPAAVADYEAVHRLHHESLAGYARTFGFEDILLVDAATGTVLYSVAKAPDLGARLDQDGYRETGLGVVAARARELASGEPAAVVDFAPYPANGGRPAAFVAAPIRADNGPAGVLVARLSAREIDDVMTGGGAWRQEGLGESGETYLVGADGLMRSDSRFQMQAPDDYHERLRRFGYSEGEIERIRRSGSSVLAQRVETDAVRRALDGVANTIRILDYRGVPVLSSYTPLDLPGLKWVLLSEIDEEEAFEPIREMRDRLALVALAVSAVFLAVGYSFAQRTARPLRGLTAEIDRLRGEGLAAADSLDNFTDADDEVARLAESFQVLTERLRETTVSRDYLDNLLGSMINAVLVVADTPQGPVIRSANRASSKLLGWPSGELVGHPLQDVLGSAAPRAEWWQGGEAKPRYRFHPGPQPPPDWLVRLRQDGSLPPIEKTLRAADGRLIPVLFSAALLQARAGETPDVVCVAEDITELRRAEHQLRVLAGRLFSAQEEERARLARELHDDVTQRLGILAIEAGKLARSGALPANEREAAAGLKEQAIRLSEDVQGLSRRLHPSILTDLGLVSALRAECNGLAKRLEVPVSFAAEDPPDELPTEARVNLYRIAQECFANIARHAAPTEVNVELGVVDGKVRLTIEDDGAGFDPAAVRRRGGLGLASMEERARMSGGRAAVDSAPGRGTKVTVEIPAEGARA